jgi:DNA modification methylase
VLDPFCGTGTTNVECKLHNITSVGIELNPFPYFASKVKVNWGIDPKILISNANLIAKMALSEINRWGIDDNQFTESIPGKLLMLPPDSEKLLIKNSISPVPEHKSIILLECIRKFGEKEFIEYQELAFAKSLVFHISNLAFGPEVGVGKIIKDVPVVSNWLVEIQKIANDLVRFGNNKTTANIYQLDARELSLDLEPNSIDYVITSPPYPNEKDYTRTTRLESVFLGFINHTDDLRSVKRGLVRSNTRGIYKLDDDFVEIEDIAEIMDLTENIEKRRIQLGKTSGFEKMYHKVTMNYFGGMARHLKDLRRVLKPGAKLAYVVGDQASYFRILIKTGELLGTVAKKYGYEVIGNDLFRTRLATATREQLREEVLLLRWPG